MKKFIPGRCHTYEGDKASGQAGIGTNQILLKTKQKGHVQLIYFQEVLLLISRKFLDSRNWNPWNSSLPRLICVLTVQLGAWRDLLMSGYVNKIMKKFTRFIFCFLVQWPIEKMAARQMCWICKQNSRSSGQHQGYGWGSLIHQSRKRKHMDKDLLNWLTEIDHFCKTV